jgi:DNA-binding MarR family transcriptional regulator
MKKGYSYSVIQVMVQKLRHRAYSIGHLAKEMRMTRQTTSRYLNHLYNKKNRRGQRIYDLKRKRVGKFIFFKIN